jgi:hypothetical protein
MSIRTLIRIAALSAALLLVSPIVWRTAGPVLLVAALGLPVLSLAYLVSLAGGSDLTRWQLRYHLPSGAGQEDPSELSFSGRSSGHLEHVLHFLADRTGHFVLEASPTGLVLEIPEAFDRYVEAQLPRALPEVRLSKSDENGERPSAGTFFLCIASASRDLLRWATEGREREVRLHIHQGPHATVIAQTDGTRPPGRWVRLPLPRLLRRLWCDLPLWDDLSFGTRLSSLLPLTDDVTVYSSHSRLHNLVPPDEYTPAQAGRPLGESTDGRPLTLGYEVPLFTIGAPSAFLAQQALADLQAGWSVIAVSPHRNVLDRIAREAGGTSIHWLDPQYAHRSAHLALVSAEEWETQSDQTVVEATQTFLATQGVDIHLPAVGVFCKQLIRTMVSSARDAGRDVSFTNLHAVSQSTRALRSFLMEAHRLSNPDAQELLAQLDDEGGYVQAVTILSAIRTALGPLEAGPLHTLCQPPFLNIGQLLSEGGLLLVPMTDTDFPRHDRLLSAMLDLTLNRILATLHQPDLRSAASSAVSLHLHDPHVYRDDHGRRWIDVARRDPQLSLLLDVQQPDRYIPREGSQIVFRCSDALASRLIDDWRLPASLTDLTELPADTAVARLPGMVVTLKVRTQ